MPVPAAFSAGTQGAGAEPGNSHPPSRRTPWPRIRSTVTSATRKVLREAYESVEQEEDHHLFHTKGWLRELWIRSLGMPAVLPPLEEIRKVQTAIGASRAAQAREEMLAQTK